MKISETLIFPSENGCQKIFGGTFLMIFIPIHNKKNGSNVLKP